MLDPRDWKAVFEIYARDPALALALAYQFFELKQSLQRGPKGIPEAITGLDQAIEHLYPHIAKDEDLLTVLKKSLLRSKRRRTVKADIAPKKRSRISLVAPVEKSAKKRKAS